jgi:hypothetical protein
MKVYDQLGDILAGELLHGGFNIVLERFELVWAESADIDLETWIERVREYSEIHFLPLRFDRRAGCTI